MRTPLDTALRSAYSGYAEAMATTHRISRYPIRTNRGTGQTIPLGTTILAPYSRCAGGDGHHPPNIPSSPDAPIGTYRGTGQTIRFGTMKLEPNSAYAGGDGHRTPNTPSVPMSHRDVSRGVLLLTPKHPRESRHPRPPSLLPQHSHLQAAPRRRSQGPLALRQPRQAAPRPRAESL